MQIEYFHYMGFDEIDSTQLYIKRELDKGVLQHGDVVSALYQSRGIGRNDRVWHSISGNVSLSMVLEPSIDVTFVPQITYLTGVALAKTIIHFFPAIDVKIKWVNDLLISKLKVAGILCEVYKSKYVIVGVGLNLLSSPEILNAGGIALSDFGTQIDREVFISKFLEFFKTYYNQWDTLGFAPIRNAWQKLSLHHPGDPITVKYSAGKVVSGKFVEINPEGLLCLDVAGKSFTISGGEV